MWEAEINRTENDWCNWACAHLPIKAAWALLPVPSPDISEISPENPPIELDAMTGPLEFRPYNIGKILKLDLGEISEATPHNNVIAPRKQYISCTPASYPSCTAICYLPCPNFLPLTQYLVYTTY